MMTEEYAVGRTQVLAAQIVRVAGAQTMLSFRWHLGRDRRVARSQKGGRGGGGYAKTYVVQ